MSQLFSDHCSSCHANGNRQGGFGDILNMELLTRADSKYVSVGSPENSLLYKRMNSSNQPMPPKAVLSKEQIDLVRQWIAAEGLVTTAARERVKMSDLFKIIREDFDLQQNRKELRYIHFVNLWNSGASEAEVQRHREGLSKLLNMLSTRNKIEKPVAIDGKGLIFRIDLADYDLQNPFGLNPPDNPAARIGRWKEVFESRRPARDTAAEDAFFAANYQVVPPEYASGLACEKGKAQNPYKCNSHLRWMKSVMTVNNANPLTGASMDAVLQDYVSNAGKEQKILQNETDDFVTLPNLLVANGAAGSYALGIVNKDGTIGKSQVIPFKKSPVVLKDPSKPYAYPENQIAYSQEHTPIPLMRGDWFIAQVLGNFKQRIYYHLAGIPADTGVLDIALGIDDEGALLRDNAADPSGNKLAPIIMRSGFTDSGVSQNHRILERIETQQFSDKALWRSYEFNKADDGANKYHHALKYPFGPVLFPNSDPAALGYECLNMFSNPNDVFKDFSGSTIIDWGLKYWTQTPINFDFIRPGKKADTTQLSSSDKFIYSRFYETNGSPKQLPANTIECNDNKGGKNIREADKVFDFHGFEYQFMRPNGLQGFATVATNAFITDFKVPSDEAFKTTRAVFATLPETGQKVVVQPLSCLSCHSRGLIDKRDAVNPYVKQSGLFSDVQKEKADRIYVAPEKFTARLEKDNQTIQAAISATGVQVSDEEPNVAAYKRFVSRVKLEVLAADVGVASDKLSQIIRAAQGTADQKLYDDLAALTISNGDVLRESAENHLSRLIELSMAAGYFE